MAGKMTQGRVRQPSGAPLGEPQQQCSRGGADCRPSVAFTTYTRHRPEAQSGATHDAPLPSAVTRPVCGVRAQHHLLQSFTPRGQRMGDGDRGQEMGTGERGLGIGKRGRGEGTQSHPPWAQARHSTHRKKRPSETKWDTLRERWRLQLKVLSKGGHGWRSACGLQGSLRR